MKSSINPKEKARLRHMYQRWVALNKVSPDKARAFQNSCSAAEKGYRSRCRTAMRTADGVENTLPLLIDSYMAIYYPRTGRVIWHEHPDEELRGKDALRYPKRKTKVKVRNETGRFVLETKDGPDVLGPPIIYGEGGRPYTAARLCYEAIHGKVPPDHLVYSVDSRVDPLIATNLRCVPRSSEEKPVELPQELKDKLRELREARERRDNA